MCCQCQLRYSIRLVTVTPPPLRRGRALFVFRNLISVPSPSPPPFCHAPPPRCVQDLHALNLETLSWSKVELEKGQTLPSPRDKLGCVAVGNQLFLFGGFGPKGEPTPGESDDGEQEERQAGCEFTWFNDVWPWLGLAISTISLAGKRSFFEGNLVAAWFSYRRRLAKKKRGKGRRLASCLILVLSLSPVYLVGGPPCALCEARAYFTA